MPVLSTIRRALTRALGPLASVRGSGGWFPIIREPSTGAWQRNEELNADTALSYFAVFACTTLIAQDIGKVRLRLVEQDDNGIWNEISSPAFSPVLRKPNRYQSINKFVEGWVVSKLSNGNAYVLKQRDGRGVVNALYLLDPMRVTPLVTTSGDIYYQLGRDDLSQVPLFGADGEPIIVPASEMIHDPMVCLFHPLIGVSPIYACGISALQGLSIQRNSSKFFANGSNPGGVLTAPQHIGDDIAKRLKDYWDANFGGENAGKVAVLGDGLKYEQMALTAVEAQLIDQLKWTAETICACYHVPPYLVFPDRTVPNSNPEPLVQMYYSECLQSLMTGMEVALDDGLELPTATGTEFDPDDLIWLDVATKTAAAKDAISAGTLSPNESRKKYFGLGPVTGGDTPYMQQQMFSLAALAERDSEKPFAKPTPATPSTAPTNPVPQDDDQVSEDDAATVKTLFIEKGLLHAS